MKLKEYIDHLQSIYNEYGDLELCYAADDEGNSYCRGVFDPSVRLTSEKGYYFDECIPPDELDDEEYSDGYYKPIDEYQKIVLIN